MHQQQHFQQERPRRFWWALLIILVCLVGTIFYVLPLLSSVGGTSSPSYPGGWSDAQQRQIAFALAQNTQKYRIQIHEVRIINYGDAFMRVTGNPTSLRPDHPFDGMNSPSGAKNDTHSEAKLKGWALATIRKSQQGLPSGSTINVLIFSQVIVCTPCRQDVQAWANDLQRAAPSGVRVNLYIWQQKNFDIDHPDQTPVTSQQDVQFAVSATAP